MSNEDFTADLTMICFNAADIASIFTALVKSEQLEMNPNVAMYCIISEIGLMETVFYLNVIGSDKA